MKNKVIYYALAITFVAYFLFLKDLLDQTITSNFSIHLIIIMITSFYVYIFYKFITGKKILRGDRSTMFLLYIITLIILFFSKDFFTSNYIYFNLNVRYISNSLNTSLGIAFLMMNVIYIIPLGYVYRELDWVIRLIFPILIFLVVELLQLYYNLGVFDINDIILNCLGFYIGAFLIPILLKR